MAKRVSEHAEPFNPVGAYLRRELDKSRGEAWVQTDPAILKRANQAASNVEITLNTWITEAILTQLKKEGF